MGQDVAVGVDPVGVDRKAQVFGKLLHVDRYPPSSQAREVRLWLIEKPLPCCRLDADGGNQDFRLSVGPMRELNRDTVVGLAFVIASVSVLLKVAQASVNPTSFGGSSLLIILGCIRLAVKSMNGRPWWDQAASFLFIAAGIYGIVVALRGREEAAMDDTAVSED